MFQRTDDQETSRSNILSNGTLAIVAGTDTIKATLVLIFYHLLSNQACYERLRKEIDLTVSESDDRLDFEKLDGMKYLNACMYVTRRHHWG